MKTNTVVNTTSLLHTCCLQLLNVDNLRKFNSEIPFSHSNKAYLFSTLQRKKKKHKNRLLCMEPTWQRGRQGTKAVILQLPTSSSSGHLNTGSCSRENDWMYLALTVTVQHSPTQNSMFCEMCLT